MARPRKSITRDLRVLLEDIPGAAFLFAPGPTLLYANRRVKQRSGEIDVLRSVQRAAERWSEGHGYGTTSAQRGIELPASPGGVFAIEIAESPASVTETRRLLVFRRALPADDLLSLGGAPDPGLAKLTERQRQVASLISMGHTNAEIASTLGLSVSTVKNHVEHIVQKMGVHRRAVLAAYLASGARWHQQRGRAKGA